MTIDYAKAYSNERMVHAHMKRCQREAVLANKATRSVAAHPIRTAIGKQLLSIGEHLSNTRPPEPSAVRDIAHAAFPHLKDMPGPANVKSETVTTTSPAWSQQLQPGEDTQQASSPWDVSLSSSTPDAPRWPDT